jgi:hypothetical protein
VCCNDRSQQQDTGGATANSSTSNSVTTVERIELPPCPPSELLIFACRAGDVTGVISALQSCHVTEDDEVSSSVLYATAKLETVALYQKLMLHQYYHGLVVIASTCRCLLRM